MIEILCPVLERPQNAAKMAESVRGATTEPWRLSFICSPHDKAEREACVAESKADSRVAVMSTYFEHGPCDYAKKINFACKWTMSEWLLLAGDDLRFHSNWDTHALQAAEESGKQVIGTNDLSNPTVMRGLHSTHPLVKRSYYLDYGTVDDPKKLLHEGYQHQFVDTEFVETAKARNQWVFCAHSHVEHLHPIFNKGEMDYTYQRGLGTAHEDSQTFYDRRHLWMKDLREVERSR